MRKPDFKAIIDEIRAARTGIADDVSARIQAELIPDEPQGDLARAILRTAAVLMADLETNRILAVTRRLEQMFGYIEGELVGQHINVLVPADLREAHTQVIGVYAAAPIEKVAGGRCVRLIGLRRDSSTFPCEIGLCPIVLHPGVRRVVVATVFDMTKVDQAP